MIDFYAMGSPNVVKIYLALEEMGLDYNVRPTDVFGGSQFSDEFRKLNPNAKVPVIVDRDGPGGRPYTVFESGAILIYLAEKTGRFLPKDGAARYDALQWMMVQMTGVGPMFGQFVHFTRYAPKGNDYSLDRYRTQARRVLDVLEGRLLATTWLGGAEYTIADIATWPWVRLVPTLMGADVARDYPKLTEWAARIAERPAAQRAVKQTDEVRTQVTAVDKANPDTMDKVFGRGAYKVA